VTSSLEAPFVIEGRGIQELKLCTIVPTSDLYREIGRLRFWLPAAYTADFSDWSLRPALGLNAPQIYTNCGALHELLVIFAHRKMICILVPALHHQSSKA
jgi:hypothetical protein